MKLRSALRRLGVTVPFFATAAAILAVSHQPPEYAPAGPPVETTGLLLGAYRPPVEPVSYEVPAGYPVEGSLFASPEFKQALATRISATALIPPSRVQPAP